jgi:hypothetical protein
VKKINLSSLLSNFSEGQQSGQTLIINPSTSRMGVVGRLGCRHDTPDLTKIPVTPIAKKTCRTRP